MIIPIFPDDVSMKYPPVINHSKGQSTIQKSLKRPFLDDFPTKTTIWFGDFPVIENLVGGLEHFYIVFFHILGIIIPIDELIFFKWVDTTSWWNHLCGLFIGTGHGQRRMVVATPLIKIGFNLINTRVSPLELWRIHIYVYMYVCTHWEIYIYVYICIYWSTWFFRSFNVTRGSSNS